MLNSRPRKTRVARPQRENKSKVVTFRLTDAEYAELANLMSKMKFDAPREFFLFGMDIVNTLHGWHASSHRFFVGIPGDKRSYQEVEFEFSPHFENN